MPADNMYQDGPRCSLDLLTAPAEETNWLIDRILPRESVTLETGREGVMKTFLALEKAHAVAEGRPFLDRECQAGRVLYLDAENPGPVFVSRLRAYGGSRNLNIWRWQDRGFPTTLEDGRLLEAAQSHDLIVVDSLKRFMHGLEENSSTDMARITQALRELTRWGAAVIALHHAPKDLLKAGYRGSTELGAGVDVTMHVSRGGLGGVETLTITIGKTRYHEEPNMVLAVERGEARPIFHVTAGRESSPSLSTSSSDLDALAVVIRDLRNEHHCPPNQTQVTEEAREQGLGSRNTVLARLRQGEGSRWRSEPDGRSRAYEPLVHLSTCPTPRGEDGLDNSSQSLQRPVQLSNCPEVREEDGLDRFPRTGDEPVHLSNGEPVQGVDSLDNTTEQVEGFDRMLSQSTTSNLSTCPGGIGKDKLDKWTDHCAAGGLSHLPSPRKEDLNHGRLNFADPAEIQAVVEWPGYPEEICYLIRGLPVPPSRFAN